MKILSFPLNGIKGIGLILPFLFSGLLACQEETPTHQGDTDITPTQSTSTTNTVTSSTQDSPTINTSSSLQGTVASIEGNSYTIQDVAGKNFSVEPTASVLVDESLEVGDQVAVGYSEAGQPVAVRKVRGEAKATTDSNTSASERLIEGTLDRIDQEKQIYFLTAATTGENFEFKTDKTTLIDASIAEGDLIAVSLSESQQPIAIRLVRPEK